MKEKVSELAESSEDRVSELAESSENRVAENSKKTILWISNYGYNNSYCMVTRVLVKAFLETYGQEYNFYLFCIGQTQHADFAQRVSRETGLPVNQIRFLMINGHGMTSPEDHEFMKNYILGLPYFKFLMETLKPDLTISLNDGNPLLIQQKMAKLINFKFIPYVTIDYDQLGSETKFKLTDFPAIITPALHATKIMEKEGISCPLRVLPHIVDDTLFHRLPNRKALKQKWVGHPEAFVVVAVNHNNVRKRLDLLLKAFERFCQNRPEVYLLMKTDDLETKEMYASIEAPQYDLTNYSHSQVILIQRKVSLDELLEIYNCGDVGFTMTSGEGFGLTPCEMSLCQVPQLVPNNTSHPWIFGEDYPGLIDCQQLPMDIARSRLGLEEIKRRLICIFKSYHHYDNQTEIRSEADGPLESSPNIMTLALCRNPNLGRHLQSQNIRVFEQLDPLIEFLESQLPKVQRIQVLLNTDPEFMAELDLTKLFNLQWEQRKNYLIAPKLLKNYYTFNRGSTGVPRVEHAVELLTRCYEEPEFRAKLSTIGAQKVIEKFNQTTVVETLRDLIEEFS